MSIKHGSVSYRGVSAARLQSLLSSEQAGSPWRSRREAGEQSALSG